MNTLATQATDSPAFPWLAEYPAGVPTQIDAAGIPTLVDLLEASFQRFAQRTAYTYMGRRIRYAQVDAQSQALAAYLQSLGLEKGARVALMMPNCPQYPIAVAAVLRAGYVVVNVNPLYTARELQHQLQDAGAQAIVIMENFAGTLQQCLAQTPVRHVVLATLGDSLGWLKGAVVNLVARHFKKLVPAFALPGAVPFTEALARGRSARFERPALAPDDLAVLQYTGGTTGVAKGAMLLHRNLVANTLQAQAWYGPRLQDVPADTPIVSICALPLYHIFAFTVNLMLMARIGGQSVLIPNPRDAKATLKTMAQQPFHNFPAVNTLFNVLLNHPDFAKVNWQHLRVSVGGGMAVQGAVAERWLAATGCAICEGYGLSETSPIATCTPVTVQTFSGSIGLPMPSTEIRLLDDDGQPVPLGQRGEIAIRGPQVMAGYWQRPDETAKVMTPDGFLKTGDIGVMDARGYTRIVDRKKDMILVSGFNVYPNEIEEVMAAMPGVLEVAAVGVPDANCGEAVKLVVVKQDASLTEAAVRQFAQQRLTGYKRPRVIEFRTALPKSPVGKVLRRELREPATPAPVTQA